MTVSLRVVVGVVNVLIIATVASVILSITLTSTIDAISSSATDHVLSTLEGGQGIIAGSFDDVFGQMTTLTDITKENNWAWPSSSAALTAEWSSRLVQVQATGPSRFLLVYFSDLTLMYSQIDSADDNIVSLDCLASNRVFPPDGPDLATMYYPRMPRFPNQTLRSWSTYFNATDMSVIAKPATPDVLFNASAFTGPTWIYDELANGLMSAPAKMLFGNFVVRRRDSAMPTLMVFANARRPMDVGATHYPYMLALGGITRSQLSVTLQLTVRDHGETRSLALCVDVGGRLVASSSEATMPVAVGPFRVPQGVTAASLGYSTECDSSFILDRTLVQNDTWLYCRKSVQEYGYPPLLAVGADWILASDTARTTTATTGGDKYFIGALRMRFQFQPMELFLVIILPQSAVIGSVLQGRDIAIGVTCASFAVVAVLSFVSTHVLLKPLSRIAVRMARAARFEDQAERERFSAILEVHDLQMAYHNMNEELNNIRSFVPQALLDHGDADSTDARWQGDPGRSTGMPSLMDNTSTVSGHRRKRSTKSSDGASIDIHSRLSTGGGPDSSAGKMVRRGDLVCAMTPTVVTVMTLNLSGFNREAFALPPRAVIAGLSDIVGVVTQEATTRGGVLALFHGDQLVVTFNAARRCDDHAKMAILAALSATLELRSRNALSNGSHLRARCRSRIGIATGTCLVGVAGTTTLKAFSTIGAAVQQSNLLQRIAPRYGPGCSVLVTARTVGDAGPRIVSAFVDVVRLPTRRGCEATPIAAVIGLAEDFTERDNTATPPLVDDSQDEDEDASRPVHEVLAQRNHEVQRHLDALNRGSIMMPPEGTTDRGDDDAREDAVFGGNDFVFFSPVRGDKTTAPSPRGHGGTQTLLSVSGPSSPVSLLPSAAETPHAATAAMVKARAVAKSLESRWDVISHLEHLMDARGALRIAAATFLDDDGSADVPLDNSTSDVGVARRALEASDLGEFLNLLSLCHRAEYAA